MKLLQQTGRYFLFFSLLAFIVGGIVLFFALGYMLNNEMDEDLKHTRTTLYKELNKRDSLLPTIEIMDEVIELREVSQLSDLEIFKDTMFQVSEKEDGVEVFEMELYRQYIYTEQIKGKNYRIGLNHSKIDDQHLLMTIIGMISLLFFLFLMVINLFNRYLSVRLWKPFYRIVQQVEQFNTTKATVYQPVSSNTEEFKTLDNALQKMTEKIARDFLSLKQFTENASHEMQTPLAIIQSQIELLLHHKQHDEKALQHLHQIQQSATKLSKLNKTLLLLTRIENQQFEPIESVDLKEIILQKLEALELLIVDKALEVKMDLVPVSVTANPVLSDILISNLLSNAIKHNLSNGELILHLSEDKLTIRNTGSPLKLSPAQLFERFRKEDNSSKSVGLGLAIVKEICDLYDWSIDYKNEGKWHEVIINLHQ